MNNEPVAWMRESDKAVCSNEEKLWFIEEEGSDWNYKIPLYTHPVKELSETRIKQIFVEQTGFYFDDNPADDLALMDFAKALLLEAQEK